MAKIIETNSQKESSSRAANIAEEATENILETGIQTINISSPKERLPETGNNNTPKRPRKLTLSEFLGEGLAKKEEKRASAFEKLNDKKELAKRLKNSAPCRHILNKGKCVITHCTFAHSMEDLSPPPCLFEESCKKLGCNSIHPRESRDEWLKKMGYIDIFNGKPQVLKRDEGYTRWDQRASLDPSPVINDWFKKGHDKPHASRKNDKEEDSNRWDQNIPETPQRVSLAPSPATSRSTSPNHSKNDSITFSPRDKVVIIFPERFSDRKIKKVFEALVDLDICNIEIRRTDE